MYRLPCVFISTFSGRSKRRKKKAKNVAPVAGTSQTLSKLYFLSISMA
jgi:hypothetical protein